MFKSFVTQLLQKSAVLVVKKYQPKIIGITGSVGKTSTKDAVALVLAKKFRVRATKKNYNNEIGVPMAILGVETMPRRSPFVWGSLFFRAARLLLVKDARYPEVLVLEMGADKPGDISSLVALARPEVGVLTYISHAHTEFFATIENIAAEKREIITKLGEQNVAVLNFDNPYVMQQVGYTKGKVVTYGLKAGADVRATDVHIMMDKSGLIPTGISFKINANGSSVPVALNGVINESTVPAALAAAAVGMAYDMNLLEITEALRAMRPLAGHMRLVPGIKKTLIIDDTYNSSPAAAKAALQTLAKLPIKESGERFAVLGDMLELGPATESAHREIGLLVGELGITNLITVGSASKLTAQAAVEAGLEESRVASFSDSAEAGKFLQQKMHVGDVILVKGSQSSRMEKVVKEVMAEPLQAPELLVRQEEYWLKK